MENKKEENSENKQKEVEFEDQKIEEVNIEKTLKELLDISKKNQKDIQYIKRFATWSQIWGGLKILIILIPIILGIIYLPPFLESWLGSYQEILFKSN